MATVAQLRVANGMSVVPIEVLSTTTSLRDFIEEKSATVAVEVREIVPSIGNVNFVFVIARKMNLGCAT